MGDPSGCELSVVIPLFNEHDNVPLLVDQVMAVLRPMGRRFELVLVDDGSSDGTDTILEHLASRTLSLWRCCCAATTGRRPQWRPVSLPAAARF